MAKDEKNMEATLEGEGIPEVSGKKKGMMTWVLVGGLVVLLAGGGFAGWKFFLQKDTSGKEASQAGTPGAPLSKPGPIVTLDPFLVNLTDPGEAHFLKVTVNLEVENPLDADEIQLRMAQLRDSLLILLSSKSTEDIRSVEGKFRLRDEIINRTNKLLSGGKAKGAYFTEFVMQ
jgi:flagellar FliL protein